MLRAGREKGQVTHKGKPIRLTADLSVEPYKLQESRNQYSTFLKKKISTQNFISSQTKHHKQRKNKILCKQASTQRFCHHQACFIRAPERGTTHRKEQPLPTTPETYQMVKSTNKMKNLHQ